MYYNDFEMCSPLGASVKIHNWHVYFSLSKVCVLCMCLYNCIHVTYECIYVLIGAFYYSLGNLRTRNRALLHTIQLVALAKTYVAQEYGIDCVLEHFAKAMCKLQKVKDIQFTFY